MDADYELFLLNVYEEIRNTHGRNELDSIYNWNRLLAFYLVYLSTIALAWPCEVVGNARFHLQAHTCALISYQRSGSRPSLARRPSHRRRHVIWSIDSIYAGFGVGITEIRAYVVEVVSGK